MTGRRERILLALSVLLTVVVVTAWLVVDRDSGDPGPTGPPPKAAERVPASEGSATEPDADWVAATARKHAIPVRAMQAYATTELTERRDQPKCRLHWNTVAAIGSVESAHGTLGGAGLDADGVPDKPIVGPPLDGTNGNRAIKATKESTRYHGDEEWDRAVGPFQFLTSSWLRYGGDGDGDGEADPRDIDDAALGAARHLCRPVENLDGANWVRSVYGYNNSMAYVRKVRDIANSYAEG